MLRLVEVQAKTVNVFRPASRGLLVTVTALSLEDFLLPARMAARTLSIRSLSPCKAMLTVPSGTLRAEPARFVHDRLLLDHGAEADLLDFFPADDAADGFLLGASLVCGKKGDSADEDCDKQESHATDREIHARASSV